MSDESSPQPQHTQAKRRLKYGLNVSVAILAALALVLLVNWLAFRHMPRWDMTGAGRYTLAAQSQQVLDRMEHEHEIVTLFRVNNTQLERVRDLVDEYDRRSPRLTATHIDPDRDLTRRDQFHRRLHDRFADRLEPAAAGLDTGRQRLIAAMTELPQMLPELRAILEHPDLTDSQLEQTVEALIGAVGRFDAQLEQLNDRLDTSLDAALPDYEQAQSLLEGLLNEIDQRLLAIAIDRFERAVDRRGVPNAVKESLLVLAERMEATRAEVVSGLDRLDEIEVPARYAQLRRDLRETEALVVLGQEQVRVIPARELQRRIQAHLTQAEGEPELQFLGEERITGALVSMQLERSPMVVFVSLGQEPAIGERGQYNHVAERLRSANFEIEQWTPASAGAGGMQQMQMPGGGGGEHAEPQRPDPHQPVVWVLLPSEGPANPMAAAMGGDETQEQIVEHVRRRVANGDGALVMTTIEAGDPTGVPGPMKRWLGTWGIEPGVDRILLREAGPSERAQAELQLEVSRWPGDLTVTEALAGMRGLFMQSSPLELSEPPHMAVRHWPLVQVRGDRLWAEPVENLRSPEALRTASFDPELAADTFTVGVAAEGERETENAEESGASSQPRPPRLVVVADGVWASDRLTTAGAIGGQIAPGLAEMFGAAFPANSELFVNSVYWLAGLDEMIAASPRSQDIRRISAMSETRQRAYQWTLLLGLPLLVLVLGLGVWFVRRRG